MSPEDFRATASEVQLLRDLVAERSFSGDEARVARLLRDRLAAVGWAARIDDAGNVLAELGPNDVAAPVILFLGHIDTAAGWLPVRLEACGGPRRGAGIIRGRGTVDAKGSLAAFVAGAG